MISEQFRTIFDVLPITTLFTPGRVNLIGEHTDYNGGMVLPTVISPGLDIAFAPRSDDKIHIYSDKFDEIAKRNLSAKAAGTWSDYVTGAVIFAHKAGMIQQGANVAISTTLPFGAGLSSSAAVIVGILKAAREISAHEFSDIEIAKLARRVENEFIGMPCGIMDQMAVAIARPGQALALDTDTLKYELVNLPKDHRMAVIHTGIFRELSEGRYKIRKEECDEIKKALGRNDICQIDPSDLDKLKGLDVKIQRRALHCMSEHQRTLSAIAALKHSDFDLFGHLMTQSHDSMRDNFEITLPAIDKLVEDAVRLGASGARMTGGGFGGCIVACIANDQFDVWLKALLSLHPNAFFVC